ncbi:(4Fe-4S)-binding protein [Candidatus Enterococcus mansonii]|uniref:Divergent 4Fe-4S mono-cluster domain-containing protein n=1 Tax=Candidatus Enterococcus mansonii TaxID=1834181 RepID=A0A242C5N8_9ENTE|nr:(4Fe-4S)-binding protein [Enterococcus sp. 4G2_DIV0659]OTO05573.1 hypothetical protein A5880_002746 [Enterococcus sp. 4G2_DIV0659]
MNNNQINGKKVTEEVLLENGYRKYSGTELDIYYNKDICAHIGNCVRGNSAVFEVGRRPWIMTDNGSIDENIRVLDTCPSGALKYVRKDGK